MIQCVFKISSAAVNCAKLNARNKSFTQFEDDKLSNGKSFKRSAEQIVHVKGVTYFYEKL
jgi:hypothetical protein